MISLKKKKKILRTDYANYIRPLVIKDKCEFCDCEENLVAHHDKEFSILLDETLKELNLYKIEFNEDEFNIIKTYMLGKQIQIKNITLCNKCHTELHKNKGGFSSTGKYIDINKIKEMKRKKEKEIELKEKEQKYINEVLTPYLNDNLDKVFLTAKDRTPLIEAIGLINRNNSSIKKGEIVYIKNINSLNDYLEEVGSEYRIKQFETSRTIDGNTKKYKRAWKLVK